jgi:heme exporter protein C
MHQNKQNLRRRGWLFLMLVVVLLAAALPAIGLLAPTETTMGDAQRIIYLHVPVAWLGLLGLSFMAGGGAMYLWTRNLSWDQWSQAAAELGWLCCGLTLVTGSLWAHAAWGTWWTWDPRLTSAFILWMIYSGYLILRAQWDDPHRRGRLTAVFAILGALDVPLVIVAAYWFRGIHPAAAAMEPAMRAVLWLSAAGFTLLFGVLLACRRSQLQLQAILELREQPIAQPDLAEKKENVILRARSVR